MANRVQTGGLDSLPMEFEDVNGDEKTFALIVSTTPSGGGGAGAVTIADGDDEALGARADGAANADGGTFSVISILKRLMERFTTLLNQLPNQLTLAGNLKVSIAESTVATTGSVRVQGTANSGAAVSGSPVLVAGRNDSGNVAIIPITGGAVFMRSQIDPLIIHGQLVATTTEDVVVPSRSNRSLLTLINMGSVPIYVGSTGLTSADGFALIPNVLVQLPTTAEVVALTASGTATLSYVETYY